MTKERNTITMQELGVFMSNALDNCEDTGAGLQFVRLLMAELEEQENNPPFKLAKLKDAWYSMQNFNIG